MKLTARQLRQIIKEEVQTAVRRRVLKEEVGPYGRALTALEALTEFISDLPNAEELSTIPLVNLKAALEDGAKEDNIM